MAILKHMIGEKAISGFRGVVDFYYYMGVPCARAWPKSPGRSRSPAVQAQWQPFQEAAQLAKELSPTMIDFYSRNAAGTNMTWKDLFFRSYMSGLPTEVYQGQP